MCRPISFPPRVCQVLDHLCRGCSNAEIARLLGTSESTIHKYVGTILTRLGVDSRTRAVIEALRQGLVDPIHPAGRQALGLPDLDLDRSQIDNPVNHATQIDSPVNQATKQKGEIPHWTESQERKEA